jgi:hypothetical protein
MARRGGGQGQLLTDLARADAVLQSPSRRGLFALVCALALAKVDARAASASKADIRVIAGQDSPNVNQVLDALKDKFGNIASSVDGKGLPARKASSVTLAIGPSGLRAAIAAETRGPLVALFCSSPTFRQILAESPGLRSRAQVTAIYAETSAAAQLALASAIYQRHVHVGVLVADADSVYVEGIRRAARQHDVTLTIVNHQQGGNPVREMAALGSAEVLLAVLDVGVWAPDYVREMLESAYRRRQGVIGFSPSLVAAGALAAPYATVDDVLEHLRVLLDEIDAGKLPEPSHPIYWRASFNEGVARSLDLVLTDQVRSMAKSAERRR